MILFELYGNHKGFSRLEEELETMRAKVEKQMKEEMRYIAEIVMGDGRKVKHKFRTSRNPFWFRRR